MRHGGEAQAAQNAFAGLAPEQQERVISFLNSLVIFPPDDTASNLDPGNRSAFNFPQFGHGSIPYGTPNTINHLQEVPFSPRVE